MESGEVQIGSTYAGRPWRLVMEAGKDPRNYVS